jgi:hypothetical protein
MFRDMDEVVGRVMAAPFKSLIDNAPEIVDLTLRLGWAIGEKDGGALGELLGNERFLPAGMDKDEYVELLLKTNTTLIIETHSLRVDLFHGKDLMGTVSMVLPPGAVDSAGVIYSRQNDDSTAFNMWSSETDSMLSIWSPEIDSLSKSLDQPTRATVHVFILVMESDTTRIGNSVFFEKEEERWLITSFEKDLLQVAGVRTDSGKD